MRSFHVFGLGFVLCCVLTLYYSVDPEGVGWLPQCPIFQLTGLKCAGCGVQRSLHCLLNADFKAAFSYNAFLYVVLPLFCMGMSCKRVSESAWFGYGLAIVTVLYVVIRNLVTFSI